MRKKRSANNDLTGQTFTRWFVIDRAIVPGAKGSMWNCRCECGEVRVVSLSNLRGNLSRSCGCLQRETLSKIRKTHGRSRHNNDIYTVWLNMKNRCLDKNNKQYKDYGGRGIKVCNRWLKSFENFLADVGERPGKGYSIERINTDGNYEPKNVKWATHTEQMRNTRKARRYTHNGVTKHLAEWAEEYGINVEALNYRLLTAGMPFEKAVSKPSQRLSKGQENKLVISPALS